MVAPGRGKARLDGIKDELIEVLRHRQEPMLVSEIMEFLIDHGHADEVNVITKRRALMRKISGDPNFVFAGQTNNRTIAFNIENEYTEVEQEEASNVLHMMLKKTILDGQGAVFHPDDVGGDDAMMGFNLLLRDGIIEAASHESFIFTPKSFIGYDPKSKRATALNLPHRTWESVDEIISLLFGWQHLPPTMPEAPKDEQPFLDMFLKRGPPYNKSEVMEVAIEHLRCSLQRRFQGIR